jgi:arsenite methyltransferase
MVMKKFTLKYGIDAPFWVFLLLISGTVMITVSNTFGFVKTLGLFLGGCGNVIIGLWMLLYSTIIKIKHRDVILDLAHTKKGHKLLDVGTGRGLLAISAAKRGCEVTAIDKWSIWDLAGNGRSALEKNMIEEGVSSIIVVDGDVRKLPFPQQTFDIVVSNFVIHNISSYEDRRKAIWEMWRVLKTNGRLVISDIAKTKEYFSILQTLSNDVSVHSFYYTFPFSKVIVARK